MSSVAFKASFLSQLPKRLVMCCVVVLACWYIYKATAIKAFILSFLSLAGVSGIGFSIDALGDEHETVRSVAVGHLARCGTEAIPKLVQTLQDIDPVRREHAAKSLGQMSVSCKDAMDMLKTTALPYLLECLKDECGAVRVQAAIAVWRIQQEVNVILPTLLESWNDNDRRVRYWASYGLQLIGPGAKDAVPILEKGLIEENEHVRRWAADALKAIAPEVENTKKRPIDAN